MKGLSKQERSVKEIKAAVHEACQRYREMDRMRPIVAASSDNEKWCTHCWVRVYGKTCPKCHETNTVEYKQSALNVLDFERSQEDFELGSLWGEMEAAMEAC